MDPHSKFRVAPQVMARQVGVETVILDLANRLIFGLDEEGTRVWDMIGAGHSLDCICETLLREYDVPADTLRSDISALVEELSRRGLLTAT